MKYSEACEVLGLDELEQITVEMLRKAYKLSSLKHHPDRNHGDDGATARFQVSDGL